MMILRAHGWMYLYKGSDRLDKESGVMRKCRFQGEKVKPSGRGYTTRKIDCDNCIYKGTKQCTAEVRVYKDTKGEII